MSLSTLHIPQTWRPTISALVIYFPALKLLKISSLEDVLRSIEISSRLLKNSSQILDEFFKNFLGGEIANYHFYLYPMTQCFLKGISSTLP
mgnify:CR=1 FL=1